MGQAPRLHAGARACLILVLFIAVLAAGAGCASTKRDSDLPWNMQQPWESAPSIPGLSPQM